MYFSFNMASVCLSTTSFLFSQEESNLIHMYRALVRQVKDKIWHKHFRLCNLTFAQFATPLC